MQRALLSGPTVDVPHSETDPEVHRAYVDRRAAQREAYGQFVAAEDVYDPDGVGLVFAAGMQVPMEHVEKWDLGTYGKVRRVATAEEARRGFRSPDIGPGSLIPDSGAKPPTATDKQ